MDDYFDALTREYLYNFVVEKFQMIEPFLKMKQNKDFVIDTFKNSASFIAYFEKDIDKEEDYSFERFDELMRESMKTIDNDSFKEILNGRILKNIDDKFKSKKNITYKSIVVSVFKEIALYQNRIIEQNFVKIWFDDKQRVNYDQMPQTFLSYAYYDKGISLALYLYFLVHGGFLYVNWMWSGANSDSSITKKQLDLELNKSVQFLFLRTLNSELDYYGSSQIRQWCSWEIGNYYTKNKQKKYYINFYGKRTKTNDILATFNIFKTINKGIINK